MPQQQQQQGAMQNVQQQHQQQSIQNIVIPNGTTMTPLQVQQLKIQQQQQQQQQQQKQLQMQQQQGKQQQQQQTIPIQQQQPHQILISSTQSPQAQYVLQQQPSQQQYQTIMTSGGKIIQQQPTQGMQQQLGAQQQQQAQIMRSSLQGQYQGQQVLSPQQQQQQTQMKSINQSPNSAQSPLSMAASPIKHESTSVAQHHHYGIPQHQQPPPIQHMATPGQMTGPPTIMTTIAQSPKTVTKIIKSESSDLHHTIHAVSKAIVGDGHEYDKTEGGSSLLRVDLPQDKKVLSSGPVSGGSASGGVTIGSSGKPMVALDAIRANKDEKFLNVNFLHKKFVDMARKHKLDDVATEVATLISHATQEYLKNLLEKLDVVAQHRLDLSTRVRRKNIQLSFGCTIFISMMQITDYIYI
jgi:hypothetical protein